MLQLEHWSEVNRLVKLDESMFRQSLTRWWMKSVALQVFP